MAVERVGVELGEHGDAVEPGVDGVAEGDVDEPVAAAEGHGRFRADLCERMEPCAPPAAEHNGAHPVHHVWCPDLYLLRHVGVSWGPGRARSRCAQAPHPRNVVRRHCTGWSRAGPIAGAAAGRQNRRPVRRPARRSRRVRGYLTALPACDPIHATTGGKACEQ